MDHLLKIYSAIKTPSISIDDLKKEGGDISRFMAISLPSAEKINHDPDLKSQATQELVQLLSTSSNNTMDLIDSMFENAVKTCLIDKERELICWLQTCVSTVVQHALDPSKVEIASNNSSSREVKPRSRKVASSKKKKSSDDDDAYVLSESEEEEIEAAVPTTAKRTTRKKKVVVEQEVEELEVPVPRKSSPRTKKKTATKPASDDDYTDDSSDQDECYDFIGASSSSEEGDAEVPASPKKKPLRKKKTAEETEQVVKTTTRRKPLKEATIPVIHEGAGSKAIANYFLDLASDDVALSSGYFAKSFFFPSKDSFNAFISALNSAKKTIDICVFAFTDDEVVTTLTLAKERGVQIKIITDNQQAAGKGADVKNLYESHGIPFRTDKTNGYMHNKFAIIDSATLINGSFNWSKGARFKNKENIIITNIPLCIKEFQHEFDSLWEEFE